MSVLNLKAVTDAIERAGRDLPRSAIVKLHKKVHFYCVRNIGFKTPVDTGRARGNWQSSIHEIRASVIETTGSRSEQNARIFAQANEALKDLPAYVVTYIHNHVPYVKYLEQGSSDQAPHGMVSLTVAELKTKLGGAP